VFEDRTDVSEVLDEIGLGRCPEQVIDQVHKLYVVN